MMDSFEKNSNMDGIGAFDAGEAENGEETPYVRCRACSWHRGVRNNMRYKTQNRSAAGKNPQRGKRGRRLSRILFAVAAFLIIFIIAADLLLRGPLRELAEEEVSAVASEVLNDAVLNVMRARSNAQAGELTRLEKGEGGVSMLFIDAEKLNLLASEIVREAQTLMGDAGRLTVGVPLGTATGIAALTGSGPSIDIGFDPVGSVTSKFSSRFSSEGINQTRYCAYICLTARLRLIMGGSEDVISVSHTAALCETVIIGEVPQAYTNVDSIDDALNLIPTDIE